VREALMAGGSPKRSRLSAAIAALLSATALAALWAPGAGAAISDSEELTRIGGLGTDAGQLKGVFGLASDPVTGHLFAVERGHPCKRGSAGM
jgi:hypothetical protein